MRVMVVYAHPLEDSFHAVLHRTVLTALRESGHDVDDCDLYAESFNPVMSAEERRYYHDETRNRAPVSGYVDRLLAAEALVLCHPIWSAGPPAILKGFYDRVLIPGVAFTLQDGTVRPALTHIRHLAAVVTYGGPRYIALWQCNPPRRIFSRYLWSMTGKRATRTYLAHYRMDVVTPESGRRFVAKVDRRMRRFGNA
jgi:NAD(P)H dehydrogenase (quinone)